MSRIDLSDTLLTPFSFISKKIDILVPPMMVFIFDLIIGIALRRTMIRNYYFGMGISKTTIFVLGFLELTIFFVILAWVSAMFDDLISKNETSLKDSWDRISSSFGNILISSILIAVVISLGNLLYLIPGVILAVVLTPVIPLMIKKNSSIQDAFKDSFNFSLHDGNFWFILVIVIIAYLIDLIPYVGSAISGFLYTFWISYACVKYS